MSVNVISRGSWGAKPWTSGTSSVPLSERTEYFIHYDGGTPITRTGNSIPQAIEREHLNNGWSGIGYNFVVDQAGNIYEGRGWGLQGAHCPGHNRSGIGVQIAIGGDQVPSDAALRSARALYDEACAKTGRTLAKKGHKDGFATECPGGRLYAWVKAGMPAPGGGGSTGTPYPGYLIARGAKGATVRVIQAALTQRGYGWALAPWGVDGDFGGGTERAVRAFQGDQHLDADGVVGPATWGRLVV
ncbi:peptidoglycan recognition protein family protein [Kitasatospora aureofaciens]|uniref:peptidoglycan recognition protein family protein n=1 Tax=Kitasatospora aureofaciens TaxID=1894 RepID=UPI0036F485DB